MHCAGEHSQVFLYVGQNPVTNVDPDGRRIVKVCRAKQSAANMAHHWVCMNGYGRCWGFRPLHPVSPSHPGVTVPGHVVNEDGGMYDSKGKFKDPVCSDNRVSQCELDKMLAVAQATDQAPPPYQAGNDSPQSPYNCKGWIRYLFSFTGTSPRFP